MQKYRETATDRSGNALVGISVTVKNYPAMTTAVIYSDNGVTTTPNPLTTDAYGAFSFYAADGRYSLTFSGPRVTTFTVDDVPLLEDLADGFPALAAPGGALLVGTTPAGNLASTTVQASLTELDTEKVGLHGNTSKTIQASDPDLSTYGERIQVDNPTSKAGYGVRFAFYNHTGDISTGRNDIGDALLSRWSSISMGSAWSRWDVAQGPLPVGSGLAGAPTLAQSFFIVTSETNPQNRFAAPSWQPENRLWGNVVGGGVVVPETQDFNGVLGNTRIGYDIVFGAAYARSPYTANYGGGSEHAKFLNIGLANPNSIAGGGFGWYATGHRDYPTAIAIGVGGSGYTAGDMLAFNTGLSQSLNENTQVKVLAVDGSGAVTSAEIYIAGGYSQTFASPVGVTGGTGTGATFTYTLSTSTKTPQAAFGMGGKWVTGIDGCAGPSALLFAQFSKAMMRAPNNQTIISARNAANSADVTILKLNASDQVELAGKALLARAAWTPTITADAGTFTTVTVSFARWSQINGIVQFQITLQIVTVGTATGAFLFTLPTVPVANYQSSFAGNNISDGIALSCSYNSAGAATVRCLKYDATTAIAAGKFYTITGTYEA